MARCLFACWLRSLWINTMIPVGLCVARIAVAVLFLCCPPGPCPMVASNSISDSSNSALASEPLRTATVNVELCRRPFCSVGGTRCQRCPPASLRNKSAAPFPVIFSTISLSESETIAKLKPPPFASLGIDSSHVANEQLRIVAPFR